MNEMDDVCGEWCHITQRRLRTQVLAQMTNLALHRLDKPATIYCRLANEGCSTSNKTVALIFIR